MQQVDTSHYSVLQIIYGIVKEDANPLTYQVRPRELILRSLQDWSLIHSALILLEKEGLVETRQLDTLQITLTKKGFEMCQGSANT